MKVPEGWKGGGSREMDLWMPCCWLKRLWAGRKMQPSLEAVEDEAGSLWSLERAHRYAVASFEPSKNSFELLTSRTTN